MDIDLYSAASFASGHPFDQYAWLREHAPCYRHPLPDGGSFWAVTRFDDVNRIGRETDTFSSEPTVMIDDPTGALSSDSSDKMMLMMDPPEHTAFRRLISRAFLPARGEAMRARIAGLARQIVDEVVERGECDFVQDIAGEMPSYVIAEMLGLPLDDGRKLYELTEVIHTAPEALAEGALEHAVIGMWSYASELMQARLAKPTDDLASELVHAEVDGRRLTEREFQLFFQLLIDAGGDTTRNLVASGMLELLARPDLMSSLRGASAEQIGLARDELLRFTSPVIYFRRTVLNDTEIAGQPVAAGDRVAIYYGAANRDPRAFDKPDELDVTRRNNKHLAFGSGAHLCLGQHIARIEIDELLREVLDRIEDLELVETPTWLPSNFISGPMRMPVRFKPSTRVA